MKKVRPRFYHEMSLDLAWEGLGLPDTYHEHADSVRF